MARVTGGNGARQKMKYLIIGAGGVGGALAAYMARAGLDVSLIARGAHLDVITANGLRVERSDGSAFTAWPHAFSEQAYTENPDVIFLCVKGYSMPDIMPLLKRKAEPGTTVIPLLNIYGTGGRIAAQLTGAAVADGCIYIAAQKKEPGVISMNGAIFRVVFGMRGGEHVPEALVCTAKDLKKAGISCILSDDIRRDAFRKFTFVSAMAACGQYYDAPAEEMQKPGAARDLFTGLVRELCAAAEKSGISLPPDMVEANLKILDALAPDATTSMQRDIWAGGRSEIAGLIYEVPRIAAVCGASVPLYERLSKEFRERGL